MARSLIHGVGINDADYVVARFEPIGDVKEGQKRKLAWRCPFYNRWKTMLKRCYDSNYHSERPSYVGCTVCEEWLTFSNFKRWMEQQDWEGKQLDKDMLVKGNKVYSPETCLFISGSINSFTTESAKSRGLWPLGVSLYKDGISYVAACNNPFTKKNEKLGLYSDPEKAHQAWLKRKREHVISYVSAETDRRLAKALIRWYWPAEDDYDDVAEAIMTELGLWEGK